MNINTDANYKNSFITESVPGNAGSVAQLADQNQTVLASELSINVAKSCYEPPNLLGEYGSVYGPSEQSVQRQGVYAKETQDWVIQLACKIQYATMHRPQELGMCFRELLHACGGKRQEIALAAQSKNAEQFGVLRTEDSAHVLTTWLPSHGRKDYRVASSCILKMVYAHLDSRPPGGASEVRVDSAYRNYAFSTVFQSLSPQELMRHSYFAEIDQMHKKCPPDFLSPVIDGEYVLITFEMRVEEKECALSSILIHRDIPTERDKQHRKTFGTSWDSAVPLVCHQKTVLNEGVLQECDQLFQKAVCWKPRESVASLRKTVAMLRYLLAQSAPFFRGSAAIGEWIEMSLYCFHGFSKVNYNTRECPMGVDLIALSSDSIDEFFERYDELVQTYF